MDRFKPEEEEDISNEVVGGHNAPNSTPTRFPVPAASATQMPRQAPASIPTGTSKNTYRAAVPLLDQLDDPDLPEVRKRRKLSEYAHLEALHQLRSQQAFQDLQKASHQDLKPHYEGNEVEEGDHELEAQEMALSENDEHEVDVLGSDDDGETGHYVLSAQWQASRDSVRKKRKRKSFLFGEQRYDHAERLSFGGNAEAQASPKTEAEGRQHPKLELAFGAKHARLHTARPSLYEQYDEGGDAMNAENAMNVGEEAEERLQTMYQDSNMIVSKDAQEEDETIMIVDEDEESHPPPTFKLPTTPASATRTQRSDSRQRRRSASPVAPVPRRSSRLNHNGAVEYEYDVEAQGEDNSIELLSTKRKHGRNASHFASNSEPSTPAHNKSSASTKKPPRTTSARKGTPKSVRSTPTRRKLDHGIVTTQDVSNFYASLQPTHYHERIPQPKGMVPVLFSYQLRAVSWMMKRENLLWMKDSVRGGILADEMGLGKTIEIIGLIISNTRAKFFRPPEQAGISSSNQSFTLIPEQGEAQEPLILRLRLDQFVDPPEGIHDGSCSLIVCPEILLPQWKEEMQRHAPSLNIHTYRGVPNLTTLEKHLDVIGENIFAMYDVVLCSYETLAKEFPYATKPAVKTRFQQVQPSTPLAKLRWWRLIMDEAQMFSQGASNAGKLLRHLEAVNRWAVSGTPIRKDFSDLRGLLLFLDAEAFYFKTTPETLAFLKEIAWRHQMDQVSDEIIIPPAETHLLKVNLNALEAFGATKLASKLKTRLSFYNDPEASNQIEMPPNDQSNQTQSKESDQMMQIDNPALPPPTSVPTPVSTAMGEILSMQTGKYSSCPYQVLLDRYLEKSTLVQASDRAVLSRALSTHISNEFYSAQIEVCQAYNAYGDALLLKCKKLKSLEKLTSAQQAQLDLLLAHASMAYQQALDLVMYKTNTPIHEKLVVLRTPLFVLSPPSAPFSAVWYHTLKNIVETMRYQGREEEANLLEQRAESVRGTALQSQFNSVATARFKFISTKQETSRISRNRQNNPRGEWWRQALEWIGANVPDFCARLRKGVRQLIDTQFQVARTHVLQLNVATVEDVIDKLELDFLRMDAQRLQAVALAKTPVPTSGAFLDDFYDTLDRTEDVMYAYQQLLVRDVESDGFSGLIQTKVLNLAERLILYIEYVLVERHNALMGVWRFHPENVSAEDEATMYKLVRWLLMAEASFRELELMKIELDHAQVYNKIKRDFAASLENLEDSALPQADYDDSFDHSSEHSTHLAPAQATSSQSVVSSSNPPTVDSESLVDSHAPSNHNLNETHGFSETISAATSAVVQQTAIKSGELLPSMDTPHMHDLRSKVLDALENCVSLKHQLEFVLESGREKIPPIECFGSKLAVVAAKLLEVLQDDEEQIAQPQLLRNKALIFSKWSEPLIQLSLFLRGQGIQFRFGKDAGGLDGPKQSKNLGHRLAAFRDDPEVRVLFLNSKSQSTGLTLTQANHVFILEDIESAHEQQAIGRAHRIGQTRVTHIWKMQVEPGEVPSFTEDVTNLLHLH
jgi:SNF2 family DNA or RNA helicase